MEGMNFGPEWFWGLLRILAVVGFIALMLLVAMATKWIVEWAGIAC